MVEQNLKKVCFDTLRVLQQFCFKHECFTDIGKCESPRVKNTTLKAYFCLPYYTILFCLLSEKYGISAPEPTFMDINSTSIFVDTKPACRPSTVLKVAQKAIKMSRAQRNDKGYMRQTHLSRMRKSINQSQSSPRYRKSASPTSRNTFATVQPKAQRTINMFE